jgi:L-threonylcarbamoyladenylate synthase
MKGALVSVLQMLKKGAIGVFPTDTLYGVVAKASSQKAVERVYEVKGRSEGKPLIILISSLSDIKKFGIELLPEHVTFLQTVWPGAVSVILPCAHPKFAYLHRGTKSLAFRMPKKKSLREFLHVVGPLAAPSANPQGLKPAHTIAEAKKYFGENVDFYYAGGRKVGKPSRVISLLSGKPHIIRK